MNVNLQNIPPSDTTLNELAFPLVVLVLAAMSYFLARWALGTFGMRLLRRANEELANEVAKQRVFTTLALPVPGLIILFFDPVLSQQLDSLYDIVVQLVGSYVIVAFAFVLHRFLNALEKFFTKGHEVNAANIKAVFRVLRVGNIALAAILAISVFANIPVTLILAVFGVVLAAGSIVFSDMIYNVVSNFSLRRRGLVSMGDWLEIPALQIDGTVKRIGPQLIEVRNWDNTLATVPARYLMSNTFRNWREMYSVGKRRLERTIYIDLETVRPLDDALVAAVNDLHGIATFLEKHALPDSGGLETLTNVGLYRTYLMGYLGRHPQISKDESLRVSNDDADGKGLPLTIVAYLTETQTIPYQLRDAEIYEHALAIAPRFGLRIFQFPSGYDQQSGRSTVPVETMQTPN